MALSFLEVFFSQNLNAERLNKSKHKLFYPLHVGTCAGKFIMVHALERIRGCGNKCEKKKKKGGMGVCFHKSQDFMTLVLLVTLCS